MNIYIADLSTICNHDDLLKKLSPADLTHYNSFQRKQRANQFLVAHAIQNGIKDKFKYVSIAHKGNFVIVVASGNPIGVDIEDMTKKRRFDTIGHFLGIKNIKTADEFYRAFTLYEAKYKSHTDSAARFYKLQNYMICIISNDHDVIWENATLIPEQI